MLYEYTGYLKTILYAPDADERDRLDHIEFGADEIVHWHTRDLEADREWKKTPVHRARTDDGVRLVGRFEDVRKMDTIAVDDPSFWVPLGTLGWTDSRFPVDVVRYPILEVTYRCASDNALPVCVWTYPGGMHIENLPQTRQWTTLAHLIPHGGVPAVLNAIIFRLYSTTRTTESCEIAAVRFRAMSATEAEACHKEQARLEKLGPPKRYDVLDTFFPLGVCMNADVARRNAELLGVTFGEYWDLALEDIITHHHNSIVLENVERLTVSEWEELLDHCENFGVKVIATHQIDLGDDQQELRAMIDTRIRPFAETSSILSWNIKEEPQESDFQNLMKAKAWVEDADPNHPVCVITRYSSGFPLYAPHFSAAGLDHFSSHAPWEVGDMVRNHVSLVQGQQFWIMGPAFIYATGTPEWSTCPEMRLMVNLAFANGAKGWFSYAFHNDPIWITGSCQRTLTGPFLMFSDLWLELDRRMESYSALAPLLLASRPAKLPPDLFSAIATSDDLTILPEGVPPTASFRLRGPDFNLYIVVSNDVRGMSSLNIRIAPETLRGNHIFDLSDFLRKRVWAPMNLERHLEMFPGQAQVVIVAEPDVCARWRDVIAERLIDDDKRQLAFNLKLARTYGLDLGSIENMLKSAGAGPSMENLAAMDRIRDELVNLMYTAPAIRDTRSSLIEACAAICACDGVLCRLTSRGKADLAKEWGQKVLPLAREVTHLRLELRHGKGAEVLDYCKDVAHRTLSLLAELRSLH
jgi:hypothetical protein